MASLGSISLFDELTVALMSINSVEAEHCHQDFSVSTVLEYANIPIICLDRSSPSNLTIEHDDIELTVVFTISDEPVTAAADKENIPLERLNKVSAWPYVHMLSEDKEKMNEGDNTATPLRPPIQVQIIESPPRFMDERMQAHYDQILNNATIVPSKASSGRVKGLLKVKLLDVYNLIKATIASLYHAKDTFLHLLHIMKLVASYMREGCKILLLIAQDTAYEFLLAIDRLLSELLGVVDDFLDQNVSELYSIIADIVDSLVKHIRQSAKLIGNSVKPAIRIGISTAKPFMRPFESTAAYIMKPVISKSISTALAFQQHIQYRFPIVGTLLSDVTAVASDLIQEALIIYQDEQQE